MLKKLKFSKYSKLTYIICIAVGIVILSIVISRHHKNVISPNPSINQYTKGQINPPNNSSNSGNQTSNSSNGSKTQGGSITLVAPSGNFVSNHHPNLSGSPAPNTMTSVCNTSPGATCQITFSNGNNNKSLPKQMTDSGGSTYWYWKLQDIGLSDGNWTITANSSSGDKTLSSTDPMVLVVSQ